MMAAKNIIFDLGGVLLNIDENLTIEAFRKIIRPEFDFKSLGSLHTRLIESVETGSLTRDSFCKILRPYMNDGVEWYQIEDAWCAMILDFPATRVRLVKELAGQAGLFLFSNTDPLHIEEYESDFLYRYGHPMPALFNKVFYSSDIGIRKPAPESFHYVLQHACIEPEQTLFIDDRAENCLAAESIGIKTLHVPGRSGLEAVIEQVYLWLNQ